MASKKHKAFTEFPTPNRLAAAQCEYATKEKPHKVHKDGAPNPFPPPTSKKEVFNKKDYQHIDRWASQVNID